MKPILFNTEMVRAIVEGRKTVTRRLVKPQPEPFGKAFTYKNMICSVNGLVKQAKYQVGDILYTKEMFGKDRHGEYHYRADYPEQDCEPYPIWHQSHHMPKEAARIFLKVTDVRVERLQDITEEQAKKEGVITNDAVKVSSYIYWFMQLWDGIIEKQDLDKYGWQANPFVWVYEFERCEKPEGE